MYYAVGGGMGHITRAKAFLYTTEMELDEVIICTASRYAKDLLKDYNHEIIPGELAYDKNELKNWLLDLIKRHNIGSVYLDVFPGGIIGEWMDFPSTDLKFFYLARILKFRFYLSKFKGSFPAFSEIFICEKISNDQLAWTKSLSRNTSFFNLYYQEKTSPSHLRKRFEASKPDNWIILHSGPEKEVEVLYQEAMDLAKLEKSEPKIWLISGNLPEHLKDKVKYLGAQTYNDLLELADLIISACGFNTMHQLKFIKTRHKSIPFERKYDDQFWRKENM